MQPNNQSPNQPDYSFITDIPNESVAVSKKSNKKVIFIIVASALLLVLLVVLSVGGKVKQTTTTASNTFIEDNFIKPIQSKNYQKVAEFIAVNDKDSVGPNTVNLSKTFETYDAESCKVQDVKKDSQVNTVKVVCDGKKNKLYITFNVLVGDTTQALVNTKVEII